MVFQFDGEISSSKSILNRLLIIQSFSKELTIVGQSRCDDVQKMRSALPQLLANSSAPLDCGAAGTTLRFLAMRASRVPGRHRLGGSPKLFARPQDALVDVLAQLGVRCDLTPQGLVIEGHGWVQPKTALRVDRSRSSQFASGVLLSAWDLDFDLAIETTTDSTVDSTVDSASNPPSQGYFDMTKALVTEAGMRVETTARGVTIKRHSRVTAGCLAAESDLSSAFAVAALAAVGGEAVFRHYPARSLQPDAVFPEILKKMGCEVRFESGWLSIRKAQRLKAVDWDLGNCPDLFPVLAVLCGLAHGTSRLYGAPHLAHKESSRIEATASLLTHLDGDFHQKADGMEIHGPFRPSSETFSFDPLHDHRMAMAAAVAVMAGARVEILHPEVVDKSFPEFWEIFDPT